MSPESGLLVRMEGQMLKNLPEFESKTTPVWGLGPGGGPANQPKQREVYPSQLQKETPNLQNTPLQSNHLFFSYKYTHSKLRPFSSTIPALSWGPRRLKENETPAPSERVPAAGRTHSSLQQGPAAAWLPQRAQLGPVSPHWAGFAACRSLGWHSLRCFPMHLASSSSSAWICPPCLAGQTSLGGSDRQTRTDRPG